MVYPQYSYQLSPFSPRGHLFRVNCTIVQPNPKGQCLILPSWIPGSYMIREFAKNIGRIEAKTPSHPITVAKIDKDTWQCEATDEALTISYDVYAWDLSIRAAFLDNRQGFFNGTSVFLRPIGLEHLPCELQILDSSDAAEPWRVATSLTKKQIDARGFGIYTAENYDELVDHPVQMGHFDEANFEAAGVPHHLIVTNQHKGDLKRVAQDLKALCNYQIQLFGEPAPFERYHFLLRVEDDAYGGLEHRASTALLAKRSDLPLAGEKQVSDAYRTFLGLCSHEYFHAWNIKRLKPKAFVPYDLNKENYTELLWFFEGFTSYYDDLALLRSSLISTPSYLELLARTVTRVHRGAGRLKQTLAQSSFDAWIKFYRPDENTSNSVVSYYTKGSLVALGLDLHIRLATQHARSLDDVMRLLWERHGKSQEGVDESDIRLAIHEVAATSLDDYLDLAVHSTQELPLAELLKHFGVALEMRAQEGEKDEGGAKKKNADPSKHAVYWGAKLKRDESGALALAQVETDGPAEAAGLSAGDGLVALDGLRVRQGNWESLLATYRPDQLAKLHFFRRGELLESQIRFAKMPANTCDLLLQEEADEASLNARKRWLGA